MTPADQPPPGRARYFPHLAGMLILCSPALVPFLGRWEGDEQFVVYPDKLAGGLPTVCRGLTKHVTSTPIIVGERWSKARCDREELAALERVQVQVAGCFKLLPPQPVFDAASSHAWNLGAPATCGSGAMAAFNRGDWARGCQRLSRGDDGSIVWSFTSRMVNGEKVYTFVQGLANRRAAESDLCKGVSA